VERSEPRIQERQKHQRLGKDSALTPKLHVGRQVWLPAPCGLLELLRRAPYMLVVLGYAAYTLRGRPRILGCRRFWSVCTDCGTQANETGFGADRVVPDLGTFAALARRFIAESSRGRYLWMSGWITLLAVPLPSLHCRRHRPPCTTWIVVAELLLSCHGP